VKKIIAVLSVAGIVLGWYQLQSLQTPATHAHVAFVGFPLDQAKAVEIGWEDTSLARGSARERSDQIRDWLLMAVLSDAGLAESQINEILFDMPPARFGYLQPVSTFEYGLTRSRSLPEGRVLALVPAGQSEDLRADSLAHIADEQRKNTGRRAVELLVFEYQIGAGEDSATVTRRASVSGEHLYSEAAGYRAVKVTDRASLESFLKQVDDITDARLQDGLLLGGRKLHRANRGVNVEDVAALWQAQAKIDETDRKIATFEAKWKNATYRTSDEKAQLEEQFKRESARLKSELKLDRHVDGSGFSLDPDYDYDALSLYAGKLLPALGDVATPAEIAAALNALRERNANLFLEVLYKARQKDAAAPAFQILNALQQRSRFQAARYDGALKGTYVGMTLFYTDLLAKLKAVDYWDDAPIGGFKSMTEVRVAAIYRKELQDLPGTRLWFGPRERGYQLTDDEIVFARNATRIYAASSDPLQPGKESAPNASSQVFLGWWDDHYEEIAAYEGEYARLNEIMKWSLVLSWLSTHDHTISGLDRVPVTRNLWFPEWATGNDQLRYRDWRRVGFLPKGYRGSATEAMPILYSAPFSEFGSFGTISGGVSLGKKSLIQERAILTPRLQIGELRLRAGMDLKSVVSNPAEIRLVGGLKHEFKTVGGRTSTVSSIESNGVKWRATSTEIAGKPVERVYTVARNRLDIDVKFAGEADLGRFYSEVLPSQPIRVGFRARTVDRGQAFAEDLSSATARGRSLDAVIGENPHVEEVVKYGAGIGCDGCFAVKLRGTNEYLKLQAESVASAKIPQGWQARAGSLDEGAKNLNLSWISEGQLRTELQAADYIRLEAGAGSGGGSMPPTFTRGPPAGSPSDWSIAGKPVQVVKDETGAIYIPRKNLPSGWQEVSSARRLWRRSEGSGFADFLDAGDHRKILIAAADDPGPAKQSLDSLRNASRSRAETAMVEGRAAEATREIERLVMLGDEQGTLFARRAIIAVEADDAAAAAQAIRRAVSTRGDLADTIDLINRRIARIGSDTVERDNLKQLAAMLDLREGYAFTDGRRLAFEVRLADKAKGTRVATSDAIQQRGPFYVLDEVNADPYVAVPAAMPDQVARDLGTLVQLPRSDLAHARPLLIQNADGKRYRLAGDAGTWQSETSRSASRVASRTYAPYNSQQPPCSTLAQPVDPGMPSADCLEPIYLYDPPQPSSARMR
jgi:hypothetical protein